MTPEIDRESLGRRTFLRRATLAGLAVAGGPAVLAACSRQDPTVQPSPTAVPTTPVPTAQATDEAQVLVDDVIDFALASDDWEGDFGFVRMRLHPGVVDGTPVHFCRTDASDEAFANEAGLIHVPKLEPLATDDLSGRYVLVADGVADQPTILSSHPGRDDYTPAWRLHRLTWNTEPRLLESLDDVDAAADAGDVAVEETAIVVNAGIIAWGEEHMPVDEELTAYLGGGQLIEPPDLDDGSVVFKLNQCYPSTRYFALDHSLEGPAEATNTVLSPRLQGGPSEAGATARTNVFANGLSGPGPMGAQPSVFDFDSGDPAWSPYWDHYTYQWTDDAEPELLLTQDAIHAARDDGRLEEFPGAPPTEGTVFTVNCPGPILAPPTYDPSGAA